MSSAPDFPAIGWTPAAAAMYCERFGVSRAELEAQIAEENALLAAAWSAFRRRHPAGTRRQFVLEQLEASALEIATLVGAPPDRARVIARNARRMAEEHAP